MNTDDVYTGFAKDDCIERLFCKVKRGKRDFDIYMDLETEELYSETAIDVDSLKPFINIKKVKKKLNRRKIIRIYKLDRETVFKVSSLCLGNIYKLVLDADRKFLIFRNVRPECVEKDCLFEEILIGRNKKYRSLVKNEIYDDYSMLTGVDQLYVDDVREMFEFGCEAESLTKKKILELNYKNKLIKE